jgi:hypothetical protein
LGAAAGIWFVREGRGQSFNPAVNLCFLAAGFLLASAYMIYSNRVTSIPRGDQLMAGFLAPFLTLTVITLALDTTRLSNFLKHPILVALGEMSYALYIFHIPVKWVYRRALENLSIADPQAFFDFTYLPLILVFSFLVTAYVDRPFRNWLKQVWRQVSLPLLLLDLAILSLSVYYSFYFRFESMRIRDEHYTTYRLMFWSALALRMVCSTAFGAFNPSNLYRPFMQFVRPVLLAVTAGSASLMAVLYAGYYFASVRYFPLSVIVLDWLVMLALALLVRWLFRLAGFYS